MRIQFASKNVTPQHVNVEFGKYDNGNPRLRIIAESGEVLMTPSIDPTIGLDEGEIAIKNFEENEGVEAALLKAGIIDGSPKFFIRSGFLNIPVYRFGVVAVEQIKAA